MAQTFPAPDTFDRGSAQPISAQLAADFMGWWSWHPVTGDAAGMGRGKLEVLDVDIPGGSIAAEGAATCYGDSHAFEGKGHGFVRREHHAEAAPTTEKIVVTAGLRLRDVAGWPEGVDAADLMVGRVGVLLRVRDGTITDPSGAATNPDMVLEDSYGYAAYFTQGATAGELDVVLRAYGPTGYADVATTTVVAQPDDFKLTTDVRLSAYNSGGDVVLLLEWRNASGAGQQGMAVGGAGGVLGPSPRIGAGGGGATSGGFSTGYTLPEILKPKVGREWTTLLSATDSSASKVTGPGRVGIILGKEDQVVLTAPVSHTAQVLTTCDYFQASRIVVATGVETVLVRDEFRRASPQGIQLQSASLDNRWGQTGQSIQSDVAYDRASQIYVLRTGTPWIGGNEAVSINGFMGHEAAVLPTGSGGLKVTQPINTPAQNQFLTYLLAADLDGWAQRAELGFRHQNVGASYADVKIGLALRASVAGPGGTIVQLSGYWAGYVFSISGTGVCELTRHQYAVDDLSATLEQRTELIASATIAHTATSRTIQAEVYEEEGTSAPGTGPATLVMKVDGVQVSLVASSSADGVTDDGAGTIRDAGAYLLQGPRPFVALWCAFPQTDGSTSHIVEFESIELLASTSVDPADEDLASVSLSREDTGKFGTLDVPLSACQRILSSPRRSAGPFVDGRQRRSPRDTFMRRSWRCQTQALEPSELVELEEFYRDHNGTELAFDWVPLEDRAYGGGAVAVKFVSKMLEKERLDGPSPRYRVTFDLEEAVES